LKSAPDRGEHGQSAARSIREGKERTVKKEKSTGKA